MDKHRVKSWPHFFQAIIEGRKLHDFRDGTERDYKVGDILELCEYDPFKGVYTGREASARITYITSADTPCAFSSAYLKKGAVVLSLDFCGLRQETAPKPRERLHGGKLTDG